MKVGDLVRCPKVGDPTDEWYQDSYIGLVAGTCGHKVDIFRGDGTIEVWTWFDLELINEGR